MASKVTTVSDIIDRIEELEGEREALSDDLSEAHSALETFDPEDNDAAELEQNLVHASEALSDWDKSSDAVELVGLKKLLADMLPNKA